MNKKKDSDRVNGIDETLSLQIVAVIEQQKVFRILNSTLIEHNGFTGSF